jgi:hypothetical protein
MNGIFYYPGDWGLIHAHPDFFSFLDRTAQAHFNLIEVDVDDFLAVGANFCHLPVEIDRITATRTARNDDSDDLCLLLHDVKPFQNQKIRRIP